MAIVLLFTVMAGFEIASAVSAALIDQGTMTSNEGNTRIVYTANSIGDDVKIQIKKLEKEDDVFQTTSTKVLTIKDLQFGKIQVGNKVITTSLTTVQYYWANKKKLIRIK